LAKKVLEGKTTGYKYHPQLERFKQQRFPKKFINAYLHIIHQEATSRGYLFDASKIMFTKISSQITINTEQLAYEWSHLQKKLLIRSPQKYAENKKTSSVDTHPLFSPVIGPIAAREKTS